MITNTLKENQIREKLQKQSQTQQLMLTKEWDLVLTDKTTNTNKIIGKIFPDISVPYERWIFWKVEDDLHLH